MALRTVQYVLQVLRIVQPQLDTGAFIQAPVPERDVLATDTGDLITDDQGNFLLAE